MQMSERSSIAGILLIPIINGCDLIYRKSNKSCLREFTGTLDITVVYKIRNSFSDNPGKHILIAPRRARPAYEMMLRQKRRYQGMMLPL
jgi:hypothetical protein